MLLKIEKTKIGHKIKEIMDSNNRSFLCTLMWGIHLYFCKYDYRRSLIIVTLAMFLVVERLEGDEEGRSGRFRISRVSSEVQLACTSLPKL